MPRHSLITSLGLVSGLLLGTLSSVPAVAQGLNNHQTLLTPRFTSLPPGLASTNVSNATNVGAGIGNIARQQAIGSQSGGTMGSLVSTNVGTATNVAAGINNQAQQRVLGAQHGGNGVSVGLNLTGPGPLVSTNVGVATNVAAGIGNFAGQQLLKQQR